MQADSTDYLALILGKGLDAAITERDRQKALLEEEKQVLLKRVKDIDSAMLGMNARLATALTDAARRAGVTENDPREGFGYSNLTIRDFILTFLTAQKGRAKSRHLYRTAADHRFNVKSIYTSISKMIATGDLVKEELPGERGCILSLPHSR